MTPELSDPIIALLMQTPITAVVVWLVRYFMVEIKETQRTFLAQMQAEREACDERAALRDQYFAERFANAVREANRG